MSNKTVENSTVTRGLGDRKIQGGCRARMLLQTGTYDMTLDVIIAKISEIECVSV